MRKKIELEDFIALCKYFLYGMPDIDTETIQSSAEDRLRRHGMLSNLANPLAPILYRTIINRIYYGVFHYALRKTTIKISMKGEESKIHSKVYNLLDMEDSYAAKKFDDLRELRVFADYDAGYQSPLTWSTCNNMMKRALDLIRRLGYDVLLFQNFRQMQPFNSSMIKHLKCKSNDFACKKKNPYLNL